MCVCVCVCVVDVGDAGWTGGFTKVVIYPMCANSLQKVVVLATPIEGLWDIRWQTIQLTCKQLSQTN